MPAPSSLRTRDSLFVRGWHSFLTGRVMLAFSLAVLQVLSQVMNQKSEPWLFAVCAAYLLVCAMQRVMVSNHSRLSHKDVEWLPTIGLDLVVICTLQWIDKSSQNYTPLFGLPILMASVLGTLPLALGTTALSTLLMLLSVSLRHSGTGWDLREQYLQAALAGAGYFVVTYLVHQLSARLNRTEQRAIQSQIDALTQAQVSALVIQHLNDGVLVVDEAHRVQTANPAAFDLLGNASAWRQQNNGLELPDVALNEAAAWLPLYEMAQQTFQTEQPQSAEVALLHSGQSPTGLHVRTWLTSTVVADLDAAPQRLCVMFLHDLREMEARLRTEKLASMGRMSAAVAHEIRNPLAAILQANALLDEELTDAGQKRLSAMVHQNAERLKRIAEEVLDIARVQQQIANAPNAALELDLSVGAIWRDWQGIEPLKRQASLSLQAPQIHVEFDIDHLRRVINNLLDNAQRYIPKQPDALQLSTSIAPTGQVSLQIWSEGQPLDKSVERHLFEPFFSSESRSSGLGLYICRELCQRHGAAITYQRITHVTAGKERGGNAFTIHFRQTSRATGPASLFDTIVI